MNSNYKHLTPGEKMVWAAVFARESNTRGTLTRAHQWAEENSYKYHEPEVHEKWLEEERDALCQAAEIAGSQVQMLRACLTEVEEGWGENSDIANMLKDILEE